MKHWLNRSALGVLFAAFAFGVSAQPYPTKPIRIVVPFPAGGTTDVLARAAAQKLTETLGQSAVVDNRPGAGGNIGAELVAKAPPDGYTLLMGTVGTHAINPSLYPKMPYDHVRDFVPVILVAGVPNVLVINPALPVNSVPDLIAYAKANPGNPDSAMVGTSGNAAARSLLVTASALSLPPLMSASDDGRLSNISCTCPPTRSWRAGALPL